MFTETIYIKAGYAKKGKNNVSQFTNRDYFEINEKIGKRILRVSIADRGKEPHQEVNVHAVLATLTGEFVTNHIFNPNTQETEIIEWLKRVRLAAEDLVNRESEFSEEIKKIQLEFGEYVDKGLIERR